MYPIVFLWSHPRSMSTATERVMRERGDLECLHEPFLHYYYLQKNRKKLNEFDAIEGHPTTYQETRDMILEKAHQSPIFVKDMSYYVVPEILNDIEFCRRIKHAFLIRNPLRSILSYYKLDPELRSEEVGIQAQWQHYQGLENLGIDSVVLEAEAIQNNPRGTLSTFWQAVDLEYCDHAFDWDDSAMPESWQYVRGWHGQASGSGGIQPASREDDAKAHEEFNRLADESPFLHDYLATHDVSYQALRGFCLKV